MSAVTVTELLVRPFRSDPSTVTTAETFLRHFPNLRVAEVDFATAREAARVRAMTGLKTPDAIVIATAVTLGIKAIVANDDRWRLAVASIGGGLELCHLDAHLPL